MTPDLWMLVAAVALCWTQIMIAATPGLLKSVPASLGNREAPLSRDGFPGRANRAAANMKENLPMFAVLVLVAHVSDSADATSALGAQIFVGARVLHGLVYMAGIPVARTLLWGASVVGMGMVASSLF